MINIVENFDKGQSYSWGMLRPGDVIRNSKWTTENDYALVITRAEDYINVFRFGLGAIQTIRPTDCPGESFYKYDANLIITKRI